MPTIDEKRVYTDNTDVETVYLASGLGLVAVSVSDDLIGEFGVARRCRARDVATAGPLVAVATDEDVLLARRTEADDAGAPGPDLDFAATGFGPATAVGFDGETMLAGDADGRVSGRDTVTSEPTWTDVGDAATSVRAIDGGLVAAADGVYRVDSPGLIHAGLDDVRDVDDEPLVATGSGLYKLGNGWMEALSGPVDAVDAVGERALAARDGSLFARGSETGDDATEERWREEALPVDGDVVAVTHGAAASYAVTDDGTLAVRLPGEEWRYRGLGVRDVAAAAV
ncbi:HVO_0234 family beta-propeller protein [Halobellus sp. GM3]|uniref:HVO_0234 family beta-propeller protein n=1 Tax=Halobellus sp. GM3 TaxID=3458410 RepID=UPI00403D62FE